MTRAEWSRIKLCVDKHGYYVFSNGAAIYSFPCLYGKEYSARDKAGMTIDTSYNIDALRYLFD